MNELPDLSAPITQAAFARLVDVSEARVSQLAAEGLLERDGSAQAWLHAYCRRLRERAAGRASQGDLDLAQERAALARAQRIAQELKTSIARGEYAPIELLENVLATASSAIVNRLDGLEGLLRKVAPDLDESTRTAILGSIADARNEWVRSTARIVVQQLEDLDEADEEGGAA